MTTLNERCRRCGHHNDNVDSEVCTQCWVDMGQMELNFEGYPVDDEGFVTVDDDPWTVRFGREGP